MVTSLFYQGIHSQKLIAAVLVRARKLEPITLPVSNGTDTHKSSWVHMVHDAVAKKQLPCSSWRRKETQESMGSVLSSQSRALMFNVRRHGGLRTYCHPVPVLLHFSWDVLACLLTYDFDICLNKM